MEPIKMKVRAEGTVVYAKGTTELRVIIPRKYNNEAREYIVGMVREVADRENGKIMFERIEH